jgi:hypothetical protein
MVLGDTVDQTIPEVDIVNFCRGLIVEAGVERHVPGKVVASFRTARTAQRIDDEATLAFKGVPSEPHGTEVRLGKWS